MSPTMVGVLVTALGIILTFVGVFLTVRKDRLNKAMDVKIEEEKSRTAKEAAAAQTAKDSYDQVQENLNAAWAESRSLREDLAKARQEQDDLWRKQQEMRRLYEQQLTDQKKTYEDQLSALKEEHARQLLEIKSEYERKDADKDHYIVFLQSHINEGKGAPAPAMAEVLGEH